MSENSSWRMTILAIFILCPFFPLVQVKGQGLSAIKNKIQKNLTYNAQHNFC